MKNKKMDFSIHPNPGPTLALAGPWFLLSVLYGAVFFSTPSRDYGLVLALCLSLAVFISIWVRGHSVWVQGDEFFIRDGFYRVSKRNVSDVESVKLGYRTFNYRLGLFSVPQIEIKSGDRTFLLNAKMFPPGTIKRLQKFLDTRFSLPKG